MNFCYIVFSEDSGIGEYLYAGTPDQIYCGVCKKCKLKLMFPVRIEYIYCVVCGDEIKVQQGENNLEK